MRVPISFKKDEKVLYEYLKNKLSPSIYIKELMIKDIEKQKEKKQKED